MRYVRRLVVGSADHKYPQVAEYLLSKLNDSYQGVVYLDRHDQQMILLRSSHQSVKLAQSGVPWKNRFTFYDQVELWG